MSKTAFWIDWIDEEKSRRDVGRKRALTPDQHRAVNARYPGCTLQHCEECGNPTERCEEDSMTSEDGSKVLCEPCWKALDISEECP